MIFIQLTDMSQASYWEPIDSDFERLVPLELGLTKGSPKSLEVANKIRQFYFDGETLSPTSKDQYINRRLALGRGDLGGRLVYLMVEPPLICLYFDYCSTLKQVLIVSGSLHGVHGSELITDEMFVCGIHETLKLQSASYDNIYNYYFTFD
ncbi:unnamed protein product, partial [Timema podura]|nr:unnamed protein product [Timema podura]